MNVTYDEQQDFDGEELSNEKVQKFYQLLKEMNTPLFEGFVILYIVIEDQSPFRCIRGFMSLSC